MELGSSIYRQYENDTCFGKQSSMTEVNVHILDLSIIRIFEETLLFNPNNKLTRTRRDVLKDKVQLTKEFLIRLTALEALCVQYKVECRTNVSIVVKALQPPLLPAAPVTALEV
ncbi:hypothetical protein Tco_0791602 [Tanacetum coccineum]